MSQPPRCQLLWRRGKIFFCVAVSFLASIQFYQLFNVTTKQNELLPNDAPTIIVRDDKARARTGEKNSGDGGGGTVTSNLPITVKCTFCEGEKGTFNQDWVVPEAGGNTCGSMKTMAAGQLNGSDICALIQGKERLCCPGLQASRNVTKHPVIVKSKSDSNGNGNMTTSHPPIKDIRWSRPSIDANFTSPRKNQTLPTENLAACRILVTSQGGVGSSSYLRQLKLVKHVRTNRPADQDGLKHNAASCWKSHNSYSISDNGRCFSKVLVIIGDPFHTIESTWRRYRAFHLNKLRSGCNKVGDPYKENVTLHEIYSEMLDVGKDMTGIDQYVQSWYKASQDRSNWPEIKLVTSQTLYDNAVEFAIWLGVNDEDLRHFSHFSFEKSKMRSSSVPNVTKGERVRLNEIFKDVTRIAMLVTETPFSSDGGSTTKCAFCKEGIPTPDMLVPQTGGNTCSSIKLLAVKEYNGTDTCKIIQEKESVCCPEPEQPRHATSDAAVVEFLKKNLLLCELQSQPPHRRCSSYGNITNTFTHLFLYNPTIRDKFLCNSTLIIRPKSMIPLTYDDIHNKCGGGKDLVHEIAFRSHSFPQPPTMENRHQFPGILIENRDKGEVPTKQIIASLRSQQLSTTKNAFETPLSLRLDDTFSSNVIASKEKSPKPPKMYGYYNDDSFSSKENTILNDEQCDIKCAAEPSKGGIVFQQYVYGTDWLFTFSIEGEQIMPVRVDENAWKRNEFYGTTSFKSEIPRAYSYAHELLTVGIPADKFPPVDYSSAIKGASFLAKNCRSMNHREKVVKQLMDASFRVDSLSKCLHNAEPPKEVTMTMGMKSKSEIMQKYIFHLAFENQNTDDYITEKLWQTLKAGTIPVYLGAPNIDQLFFPYHSFINVNDFSTTQELAHYLIEVANNETLYNSYHEWRKEPLPKAFMDKYLPVLGRNNCRLCRWAHARKYGLGWNHEQQVLKPIALPREACVNAGLIRHPAVESWWEVGGDGKLVSVKVKSSSSNESSSSTSCSLDEKVSMMTIEGALSRSVWSNDGTTDILLQGRSSKRLLLRLEFPMKEHKPLHQINSHTVWIQNEVSRISLVMVDGNGHGATHLVSSAESGFIYIEMHPSSIPLRIRIIIEDYDHFHKGSDQYETYYGQLMGKDVLIHPQLFALKRESIDIRNNMSMILKTIEDYLSL